jgi:hypothetical protein
MSQRRAILVDKYIVTPTSSYIIHFTQKNNIKNGLKHAPEKHFNTGG